MKIKSPPLYLTILIAMVIGIGVGYLFLWMGQGDLVNNWIKPWGTIFIKLLKLIAIPLVFISLLKGVAK